MKIKYKKYPRVYEKVFTCEETLGRFDINKFKTDYPEGPQSYINKFHSYFYDFDRFFFQKMVEYYWLQKRFIYEGIKKKTYLRTVIRVDSAYSTFIKHNLGFNYQMFTSTFIFGKIVGYLDDFFDDFDGHNPFEEPDYYKFPYNNIGLAHISLVYQMDERLDLLKEAEDGKMSYYEFLDFVINYINCVNDEMGKMVFTLYRPLDKSNFYVQYHFRKGAKVGFAKATESVKKLRRKTYEYKKYKTEAGDVHEHQVQ